MITWCNWYNGRVSKTVAWLKGDQHICDMQDFKSIWNFIWTRTHRTIVLWHATTMIIRPLKKKKEKIKDSNWWMNKWKIQRLIRVPRWKIVNVSMDARNLFSVDSLVELNVIGTSINHLRYRANNVHVIKLCTLLEMCWYAYANLVSRASGLRYDISMCI